MEKTEQNPTNLPESGSSPLSSSLDYSTTGTDRLLTVLYREVEALKNKVVDLENKKIIDDTQIPTEILEQNGMLVSQKKKLKRGKGFRPLLIHEIEESKKHSPYAAGQARWLGVSMPTFKKYAKMYAIYEPKPNAKGKRNMFDPLRGKYPLQEILEGKHPNVSDWTVKDKLIRSGTFPPKCNICGYDKRRITDNKIGLLLDHIDGDQKNFKKENLQLLCFNCTYECGRGYIRRGKHIFDPDWIQDARIDEIDKRNRW